MSTTNFQTNEEFEAYMEELGAQYHYSCFRENKGDVCHLLADWYLNKKMYDKAISQYKYTSDKFGFARSCYKYGLALLTGTGVEKDVQKSLEYLTKSCDNGDPQGCYSAGIAHQQIADKSNPLAARKMFEKFCYSDHPLGAQGCFQACSESIRLSEMNDAYRYASKGCELNNPKCCFNLGLMYEKGDGIEKNPTLGKEFKDKAKGLADHMSIT